MENVVKETEKKWLWKRWRQKEKLLNNGQIKKSEKEEKKKREMGRGKTSEKVDEKPEKILEGGKGREGLQLAK